MTHEGSVSAPPARVRVALPAGWSLLAGQTESPAGPEHSGASGMSGLVLSALADMHASITRLQESGVEIALVAAGIELVDSTPVPISVTLAVVPTAPVGPAESSPADAADSITDFELSRDEMQLGGEVIPLSVLRYAKRAPAGPPRAAVLSFIAPAAVDIRVVRIGCDAIASTLAFA